MFAWILKTLRSRGLVPAISDTERAALEAGDVWIDAELFSGKPDLRRIASEVYPGLDERERAFLDGPCEELCRLVRPWDVSRARCLPPEVWNFLKANRFFGMTVPREYGGLGFSPLGVSAVIGKLSSRSLPVSIVVLLPNSVGPAELIAHHGTKEQKERFLPRLAVGDEIPCFALTEPNAGSDAASMQASGTVFRAADGSVQLRLDFRKRYITLAPVATLLGLAFRLSDPENLLGHGPEPGITVALVHAGTPGLSLGRWHDAMGVPFPVGPVEGRDVVVPVDRILGGPGRGWQMLMEALSAGRSVSLPAGAAAGAKAAVRYMGAYAAVRRQFGIPIGRFEGIEEPLARIGGLAYLMEAARVFTCGAVGAGRKPAVISAIVKYHETELARKIVADAMDVAGGAALCRGPNNLLADGWCGAPIGITVEGANILTRTLMMFGQGALRCHPFAYRELRAMAEGDAAGFRAAVLGHLGFLLRNVVRGFVRELTRGRLVSAPVAGAMAPHWRTLSWCSTRFAVLAEAAMAGLGPRLKRKEKLTGRFADALSWMYLAAATLRRFEAEGRREEDIPIARWAVEHALAQVQTAFEGILENFEAPGLGWFFRGPVAWWVRLNRVGRPPSDRLGGKVAALIQVPGAQRDRLTEGLFRSQDPAERPYQLEQALALASRAEPLWGRLREAARAGRLQEGTVESQFDPAVAAGVLTAEEAALAREALRVRDAVIEVDSFTTEEFLGFGGPPTPSSPRSA